MTTMVVILVTNLTFMTMLTSLYIDVAVEILAKYIVMDNANCSENDVDYKDDEYVEKMMTMTTKMMPIMWIMMLLMMM